MLGYFSRLETADKECNERKAKGRKQTMETEIMVSSSVALEMPRKQQHVI